MTATEALARAHALREAFRQLKQGENVGYDLPRYLAALGYEVRPIDPDPSSDQYEAGWKAGWADRDRHPTPIHSVTAEAVSGDAARKPSPSAAADLDVDALPLEVAGTGRDTAEQEGWLSLWEAWTRLGSFVHGLTERGTLTSDQQTRWWVLQAEVHDAYAAALKERAK